MSTVFQQYVDLTGSLAMSWPGFAIGSTVQINLTCYDPADEEEVLDLTDTAVIYTMKVLGTDGQPTGDAIISRQATITDADAGECYIPIVSGDTCPLDDDDNPDPINAGFYAVDVWAEDEDGNRLDLGYGQIPITPAAGLPGDPITPAPEQDPLAQGPAGPTGATGATGPQGVGVPTLTTPLYYLRINSAGNAAEWVNTFTATITDSNPTNHGWTVGDVSDGVWMKIQAGDSNAYVDFYGTYASFTNPIRNDNVFRLGHNVNPGGGAVQAGRAALFDSWESYFNGGHIQSERHLEWVDTAGESTRFISFEGHIDVGSTALYIASTEVSIISGHDSNDVASITVDETTTRLRTPSALRMIQATDQDGTITMQNGITGDTDRAHVIIASDGSVTIYSKKNAESGATGIGHLSSEGSSPNFEWDHTLTRMLSPNGTVQVNVQDTGLLLYYNSQIEFIMQSTQPRFVRGVGMWNVTPPAAQPATPAANSAAIIALLQSYGMCA